MEDLETMGDYLEKFNPLALKDEKNRIRHFKTRDENYLFVLKDMRKYCKRGYVELALLVKHLTGMDDETCEDVHNAICKIYGCEKDKPMFVDWSDAGREKEKLQAILTGMHTITETEFDWASFEYAWLVFRNWNDNYTEKEDET